MNPTFLGNESSMIPIDGDLKEIKAWLAAADSINNVTTEKVNLKDCDKWHLEDSRGIIQHETGGFFSIRGIEVIKIQGTSRVTWEQPIIDQPEVGILGLATRSIQGNIFCLIQAKSEPGNFPRTQIAPTLQATKSNAMRLHKGLEPDFLPLFLGASKQQIIFDLLQSEQGARFLRKRNRNMLIMLNDDISYNKKFYRWISLESLNLLGKEQNLINMDLRSILGCWRLMIGSARKNRKKSRNLQVYDPVNFSNVNRAKSALAVTIYDKPVNLLSSWILTKDSISHIQNKYFSVIFLRCEANRREKNFWFQPILEPVGTGLCAMILKKNEDEIKFLMQIKFECGVDGFMQLAPTVQCLSLSYTKVATSDIPFLEHVKTADRSEIICDNILSEEGGRFFRECNRYILIEKNIEFGDLPADFVWMNMDELRTYLLIGNQVNIQARTIFSLLPLSNDS